MDKVYSDRKGVHRQTERAVREVGEQDSLMLYKGKEFQKGFMSNIVKCCQEVRMKTKQLAGLC